MNGILFKPWKIKAIAESDREWQTRRLGGLKEINEHPDEWIFKGTIDGKYWFQHPQCERDDWLYNRYIKPRYQVGEVVYIKEAYCHKVDPITAEVSYDEFWYRLDNPDVIKVDGDGGQEFNKDGTEKSPWVSPLLMPQSAARYFTKITDVRAERVQDITEEDAKAEGIDPRFCTRRIEIEPGISSFISGAKARFSILWDSINAKWKRVWNRELKIFEYWQFPWCEADAVPIPKATKHPERYHCIPNPFVFVYTFTKVDKPVGIVL